MTPISFFAQGIPKGQPRARAFARKMGNKFVARVYDAGTAESWKSCVAEAAKPFSTITLIEPVSVSLIFLFPRPKGHFKTGKNAGKLRDDAPYYHATKPDGDNLAKAIWDALKTIGLLADDCRVVHSEITKLYTFGPKTGCKIEISDPPAIFHSVTETESETPHHETAFSSAATI